MLVPVGAKQLESPYLRGAAHVFTYAGTHVVIAYAHQSDGFGSIVGQPIKANAFRQFIAGGKLEGDGKILVYQAIHLLLNLLFFLPTGFVVEIETHLAFLALDVGIV